MPDIGRGQTARSQGRAGRLAETGPPGLAGLAFWMNHFPSRWARRWLDYSTPPVRPEACTGVEDRRPRRGRRHRSLLPVPEGAGLAAAQAASCEVVARAVLSGRVLDGRTPPHAGPDGRGLRPGGSGGGLYSMQFAQLHSSEGLDSFVNGIGVGHGSERPSPASMTATI